MMSLVRDQSTFLLQVVELIRKAGELGFHVTAGELYRTPEQQALHVRHGRSQTMNSQHLKRLAIDLNVFREAADGSWTVIAAVEELRPLGEFWESLDPANRWGGNWKSFKDAPHFERLEQVGAAAPRQEPAPSRSNPPEIPGARFASPARVLAPLTAMAVGLRCANQRDDVETVQRLLNQSARQGRFATEASLKTDGAFGPRTLDAIMAFQRAVLGVPAPDGRLEPRGPGMSRLAEALSGEVDAALLELAFLRAADRDVTDLADSISRTMSARAIDTPLRRAHFLAQIGHESGELRFRAEIATGEAYENRRDLGNSEVGDGRRFKGRGLIQLTGRANYREYGRAIGREADMLANPDCVEADTAMCVDVAGWFWVKRGLNALADADDLTTITKRINGGLNGLEDRRRLLTRAKALLGV